ncbi:helix-turn-helix transcriptional regulator [Streptomyces mobaraensis]|uniref:Helix-turn-helix transcriptional regulator n=2 Tax=Streptomyces mobaraensis TaxID=35621 RepID=A0A5N5W1B7_STRMB|nr:helix-turn-helix transcriptional regulator [Streptomyces mobaraensis]
MPVGAPEWPQTHPVRQRRSAQQSLCQVCALSAGCDDGCFFLEVWSGEDDLPVGWPEGHVTTEPPVCPACLPTVAEQRRNLAGTGQAVAVMKAVPRPYGVRGALYSSDPSGRRRVVLEETFGGVVPYSDPRIGWMLASRLALRLTDAHVISVDQTTIRQPVRVLGRQRTTLTVTSTGSEGARTGGGSMSRGTARHRTIVAMRLTAREIAVLEQVALGATRKDAAAALSIRPATFGRHLERIGYKLHVHSRAAKVHAALFHADLTPPKPVVAPWEVSAEERRVWQAVATMSSMAQVASFLRLTESDAREKVRDLMARTRARDEAHLVWLGHTYRVLDTTLVPVPAAAGA